MLLNIILLLSDIILLLNSIFLPPLSWCMQLTLPTQILGSLLRSIPAVSEPAPLAGAASVLEQEQLMKEQELIISNKKSLATRHSLISANQSCFSTRLSKCSCC